MTEINKYQNGKIYKIVCNKTNLVYIGSTTQKYLSDRLKGHRCDYKRFLSTNKHYVSSFKIMENNDYFIELIELFPCNSKDELFVRERYYYDNNVCINNYKPHTTKDEKKEQCKIYNLEHKDEIKEQCKIYKLEHKDEIKEQRREYDKKYNNDHKEQQRKYREENKEKLKEQQKIYYEKRKELKKN